MKVVIKTLGLWITHDSWVAWKIMFIGTCSFKVFMKMDDQR